LFSGNIVAILKALKFPLKLKLLSGLVGNNNKKPKRSEKEEK